MDLIPWAKIAKLAGKLFKAAKKIYNAVTNFQEKLSWARNTMKRYDDAVEEATERARKNLDSGSSGTDAPSCEIGNSFTAETRVVMADGSTKPISEVEPGDEVLATDEETGETVAREVVTGIEGTGARILVDISVDTDGDGEADDTVTATDGHPIWTADPATTTQAILSQSAGDDAVSTPVDPSETDGLTGAGAGGPPNDGDILPGQWVDAIDLNVGQLLRTSTGTWIQVTAVEIQTEHATVYNLTVADLHTFSVAAADTDFLTHNCGPGRDIIGDERSDHILEGHSSSSELGKDVFPEGWDDDKILDSVADVVTSPESTYVWTKGSARYAEITGLTRKGQPAVQQITGIVDGVKIHVRYEPLTGVVHTAFTEGVGRR